MPATSYRYLVNLPNVCGGKTIVEDTRVGVHDVVGLIVNGATVDEVLRSFPNLTRAQVYEFLQQPKFHSLADSRKALGYRPIALTTYFGLPNSSTR